MATPPTEKLMQQEGVGIERVADISNKIRQAVRNALPAPAEQFLTLMVPGKVLNFNDYMGGYDQNGFQTSPLLPLSTELNQAVLCDDMPALAGIQLGPTGRSVARSYAAALSKLVAKGSVVGIDVTDIKNLGEHERRYCRAMQWLTSEDPDFPGRSRVDIYVAKQRAYTQAVENKTRAFDDALKHASNDPLNKTIALQREAYDRWVNENARTYRNYVQAAYMDWVVIGKKEAVEYWFAVVDTDSAMARVEQSKECMRASTVMDTDGSSEYQKVNLIPSNWAWLAQQKTLAGMKGAEKTVEWYTQEICRLRKMNRMILAIKESPPVHEGAVLPDLAAGDAEAETAMKGYLTAKAEYDSVVRSSEKTVEEKQEALVVVTEKRTAMSEAMAKYDQLHYSRVAVESQLTHDELVMKLSANADTHIEENDRTITTLEEERKAVIVASAGDASAMVAISIGIPGPCPVPQPLPVPGPDGNFPIVQGDYWTPISIEIAGSFSHDEAHESNTAISAGGSAGWGCVTSAAAAAHSESATAALSQMSNSTISVSFECMRVDIHRSWLRGELFYDDELSVSPGNFISPGPSKLAALIDPDNYKEVAVGSVEERQQELAKYSLFPMYPTAFLLAANVVLEIAGETSQIQSYFNTSASSGAGAAAGFNYGPFTIAASAAHSESHSACTCETTASGCRITMKSPQIIGWISQIVPALPRLPIGSTTITTSIVISASASAAAAAAGGGAGAAAAAASSATIVQETTTTH